MTGKDAQLLARIVFIDTGAISLYPHLARTVHDAAVVAGQLRVSFACECAYLKIFLDPFRGVRSANA